jgi:hypothetical protein
MPLPQADDANGRYWGSTFDVDDAVAEITGWTHFVIKMYTEDYPYNHPRGTSGWDTAKSPVCRVEL